MDTAILVSDFAERGSRFLKELAGSPSGPARAAYWVRAKVGWEDEPGDWSFVVLPGGDDPFARDAAVALAEVHAAMSCPRLGRYAPAVPWPDDPLPAAVERFDLCGDVPRWVFADELAGVRHIPGGGVFAYPRALLGVRLAGTTESRPEPIRRRVRAGRPDDDD